VESAPRRRETLALLALLLPVGGAPALHGQSAIIPPEVTARDARLVVTYDVLSLPDDERMGILGFTMPFEARPWLQLGPSAYGALTGDRGGFITLGFAAEAHAPLGGGVGVRGGSFVGAGGGRGGYHLSGGGLMLRSHLGVAFDLGRLGIVGGVSHVDFPNRGAIRGFQPYLAVEAPFRAFFLDGWTEGSSRGAGPSALPASSSELATVFRHYRIPDGVLRDNGITPQPPTMSLLGVEWRRYLSDRAFLKIESEGNLAGGSTGYMQIFGGGGFRVPLASATHLVFSGAVGVAGGGGVATGGGFLVDAGAHLQQELPGGLFLSGGAGWVGAPTGDFRALGFTTMLGYGFGMPEFGSTSVPERALDAFSPRHLRLRGVHQTYRQAADAWRAHHPGLDVNNLGLKVDFFPSPRFFLSGQGIAAQAGQAGAYMAGLLGAGVRVPVAGPVHLEGEALVGAAGGGGLQMGGGLAGQVNAGVGVDLPGSLDAFAGYGRLVALGGDFASHVIDISLGYRLSVFTR
jgi:hypothetical protein